MRTLFIVCALLGVTFIVVAQTSVQSTETQAPALVGVATNGQTIIHARESQIFMKSNVYVWKYGVRVDNPQMKLSCEVLTVEAPKIDRARGKYNSATAETNVVIDWIDGRGSNHATADKAVYTYVMTNLATLPEERWETNSFVVLTGNPVVTNSDGMFYRADPLVWDRINDVISSTNFHEGSISGHSTNTPGLMEPFTTKPTPTK
jgi:lipopolysaccharide export system protein LptA